MQFSLASAAFAPGAAGPSMIHAGRSAVRMQVAPPPEKTSGSISAMSEQMKEMRAKMEEDESTKAMMQALRGTNLNDDDSAAQGTTLRVVETRAGDDQLPLTYQPELLADYFGKRPLAVLTRIGQIMGTSAGWLSGVAIRALKGELAPGSAAEVESVAELRSIIVSLGPFFIKLGQALSIRPDILSPQAMVELQQLCDKVPSFDSALAMQTIRDELGVKDVSEVYSEITAEPVAAASLGQVYRARLKDGGDEVAVKVQRPFVLETVSLDLHLARSLGLLLRATPLSDRIDVVELLDEFASRFYQELDYIVECENGLRVERDMRVLPRIVIPKNYPQYTARRVHTAQWIEGEKLSQSKADDVGALVNLGVVAYLTQLLDTGFFHADPHPGNMMRTPQGELVILDFGLMTEVTEEQKYGMIEAIAHLIHRDYDRIGDDFISLDFIPKDTDTAPLIPALARVFDAALAGGGAKSINFQELAADLAEITFEFPFRIPPYFALVIRAISVLEGIALVGNPQFAIVDEAYPYISKRLLTDESPRLRAALRYMVYGKTGTFDSERMIDMLTALEKFVSVKDYGDGTAFKVDGVRGETALGEAGALRGTRTLVPTAGADNGAAPGGPPRDELGDAADRSRLAASAAAASNSEATAAQAREALAFFFGGDGAVFRQFLLDEVVAAADALSREAANELAVALSPIGLSPLGGAFAPPAVAPLFKALAPKLTDADRKVVTSIRELVAFFLGDLTTTAELSTVNGGALRNPEQLRTLQALLPVLRENQAELRAFGLQIVGRLAERQAARALGYVRDQVGVDRARSL